MGKNGDGACRLINELLRESQYTCHILLHQPFPGRDVILSQSAFSIRRLFLPLLFLLNPELLVKS